MALVNNQQTYKNAESQRKLFLQKDLNELQSWMSTLEAFNNELEHLSIIEKQLLKNSSVASAILAIRRKNVLVMANLCKYEQELKSEYEYGKVEYDLNRLKIHEQRRANYSKLVEDCNNFRKQMYVLISKYQRK